MKTVLITGASTGIGRAAASLFHDRGWNVVATMRTPSKSDLVPDDKMMLATLDVTDVASIDAAVAAATAGFGSIDVVVNNAGFGMVGPFEGSTPEDVRRQFETNVFGVMNVTRAVLPKMRAQRSGTIINVSSMGGRLTFPFYSLYHGTKWAVEGFSESLQFELDAFNIRIKIVEPGPIKTDFYDRSMDLLHSAPYDAVFAKAKAFMDNAGATGATPMRVAQTILHAANHGSHRLRYPVNAPHLLMHKFMGQRGWHAVLSRLMLKGRTSISE